MKIHDQIEEFIGEEQVQVMGGLTIENKISALSRVKGFSSVKFDLVDLNETAAQIKSRKIETWTCIVPKNFMMIPDKFGKKVLPYYMI